jgi:hypothetical protein
MKPGKTNAIWGVVLLLAAAFVLTNNFFGLTDIGIGRIIAAVLAVAFIVQCIASSHIAPIVIPLGVLYIIFRAPLGLPEIHTGKLIAACILASIGLGILLPHKSYSRNKCGNYGGSKEPPRVESGGKDNNPCFSVNFGTVSGSLNADSLETVRLSCNFGAMEIFFNQAGLNPNGADVYINCSFGGIQLIIPGHWQVIDRLNRTLAGVDIKFASTAENAPRLTLNGSVTLGGIEVKYI